jgi:hypothetical protein
MHAHLPLLALSLLIAAALVLALRAEGETNAAACYRNAFALMPPLTPAEQRTLDKLPAARRNDATFRLIERSEPAVHELFRGAPLPRCDWGVDLAEACDQLFAIVPKVRVVGQAACLRMHQAFQQNDVAAALDGVTALFLFARRFGREGPFIAKLVQLALEAQAIDVIAAHLPGQDAEALRVLRERLERLPDSTTLEEALQNERRFLLAYARAHLANRSREEALAGLRQAGQTESEARAILRAAGDSREGLARLLDETAAAYGELGPILVLPAAEFEPALRAFDKKHGATNPMIATFIQPAATMYGAALRAHTRFVMLRAAIDINKARSEQLPNPAVGYEGAFEYRPFKGGFELRHRAPVTHQTALRLVVGKPGLLHVLRTLLGL